MTSNSPFFWRANSNPSSQRRNTLEQANFMRVSCKARKTVRLRSTITTSAAPRDVASNPNIPLPANKSRQRLPLRFCPSQLNKVSRTRSGVGRRPSASGNPTQRLRWVPPMMRTRFIARLPRYLAFGSLERRLSQ